MTEEKNDGKKDENEPAESFPTRAFDVIVLGTGLAESLIASSASKIGKKSVLLLDANDHYGNSFGTLTEARGTDETLFKGWSVPVCLTRSGAVLETHDVVTIDDDECLLASLRRKFSVDVAFKFSLGDDRLTEEVCNSEAYKYLAFTA